MGANSGIQWTHHTFNPWIGCQRVSPGCVNCYAEHTNTFVRIQRKQGRELWGPRGDRHITSDANWKKPLAWDRAAAAAGERHRVFCASLADVFEARNDLDDARKRLWALIQCTPNLDWLLLTKRPENVLHMVPLGWHGRFPPNIWMGTTVEDQARADERVKLVRQIPAAIRFLSCEPLIEEVGVDLTGIDWVIIGGESGKEARPFKLLWALRLIEQCRLRGAAPFVKQVGRVPRMNYYAFHRWAEQMGWADNPPIFTEDGYEWSIDHDGQPPINAVVTVPMRDSHGGEPDEWPPAIRVREFPGAAL